MTHGATTRARLYGAVSRAKGDGSQGDDFTLPGAVASYAPDLALEPVHLAIRLRFDLDSATIDGEVTVTVRGNRPGARSLDLDAVSLLDLEVRDESDACAWRYDGRQVHIACAEPFAVGDERRITVAYRVHDPVSGMHFSLRDRLVLLLRSGVCAATLPPS